MSVLIDRSTRIIIQAITGKAGTLQTRVMQEYGTKVVAGVTPGKGGQSVEGVPVYNLVGDACRNHTADAVISFVPAPAVKDACFEVMDAGIPFLVLTTEGIADHDMVDIVTYGRSRGTRVLGPGTPGLIAPGRCKMGAHPSRMFIEGAVGVVSKSGALSYEASKNLTEAGIGQSTVVGIGGGPVWGLTQKDILELFQLDQQTELIVLLGEIGGGMEEEAAEFIKSHVTKPVIALIVGRTAPPGRSLGHAGAIIEGEAGTARYKIKMLEEAGVTVVKNMKEMVAAVSSKNEILRGK